ncbi:hypothetical protein BDN72DRAFT_899899 [Pluteus cervinus]|uniref:Uncharacterized protein n=1 Tax=Pluteus cervinus TaxID=181527 RepID=A0ACD3ALL1_9AGAR|nr:hypothetical protein BDN72DRAFT_899899 [Pluteus cervinus]
MAPIRSLNRNRRRSSMALTPLPQVKAGIYGINQRPVTFAPNVTPGTFTEPEGASSASEPSSPTSTLFPPSTEPAPPPARKRIPPGKRPSQGYIPRPPNAFMLFRADFVRQKHVPGSIETNHGSLSKIIGNCWRALPPSERSIWEGKAKKAKADHKQRYPDYRFRPVHNKNKDKKKEKQPAPPGTEQHCEAVAQLLLEGKKGTELEAALKRINPHSQPHHQLHMVSPGPLYMQRRSSSVPLPDFMPQYDNMAILPPPPPYSQSRPASPMSVYQRQQRMMCGLGQRRASSAGPIAGFRSWTMPSLHMPMPQPDDEPLPDVDTSLFEASFLDPNTANFSFGNDAPNLSNPFGNDLMNVAPHMQPQDSHFSPLDSLPPHEVLIQQSHQQSLYQQPMQQTSPEFTSHWSVNPGLQSSNPSQPSTVYTGSPPPLDSSIPPHAPQFASNESWKPYNTAEFTQSEITGFGSSMDPMDMGFAQQSCDDNLEMPNFGDMMNPMAFNDNYAGGYSYDGLPQQS